MHFQSIRCRLANSKFGFASPQWKSRASVPPLAMGRRRDGAAMVEFAIVAPLLFLFFFTAFEFCRVAMIRHTVDNAVYESVRRGIIPGATADEVRAQGDLVLSTIGIQNFTIDVTPAVIRQDTDEIAVRIQVPLNQNTFIPAVFFKDLVTDRSLTMVREGR